MESVKRPGKPTKELVGFFYSFMVFALERIPGLLGDSTVPGGITTFPLVVDWSLQLKRVRLNQVGRIESVILGILEGLTEETVIWQPYKKLSDKLPRHLRSQLVLGKSQTILICFEKTVYHRPDLCVRQFELVGDVKEHQRFPIVNKRRCGPKGKDGTDWSKKNNYAEYISEWDKRFQLLIDHDVYAFLEADAEPADVATGIVGGTELEGTLEHCRSLEDAEPGVATCIVGGTELEGTPERYRSLEGIYKRLDGASKKRKRGIYKRLDGASKKRKRGAAQLDGPSEKRKRVDQAFKPLTKDEKHEVTQMFSTSQHDNLRKEILVSHRSSNIDITNDLFQCLKPRGLLNDEVINLYLELLKEREKRDPQKFLKCHFFNTFYKKLISGKDGYNFQSVSYWTIHQKLGYYLFDCDMIFVPIHNGMHWSLAIINKKKEKFQYLDSLGHLDSGVMKILAMYFVDEVKEKSGERIDVSSWSQELVQDLPQ